LGHSSFVTHPFKPKFTIRFILHNMPE